MAATGSQELQPAHSAKVASTALDEPAVVASAAGPDSTAATASKKRKLDADAPAADAAASDAAGTKAQGAAETGQAALSKLDKGKAKKRRKEEQRALDNPPSFSFDTRGFQGGRFVGIKDIRDFVLHLLANDKAQQWLYVKNKSSVRRVVCLMVPGILTPDLGIAQPPLATNLPFGLAPPSEGLTSKLPVFQSLFSHACPTKAPGERNRMHSPYQHFTTCPLTSAEKERREKARKERGQQLKTSDPSVYLLNREQMADQAYPTPSALPDPLPVDQDSVFGFDAWKRADGWVEAPYQPEKPDQPKRILGIDCEMCLTDAGSELARVSVVNLEGKIIYDKLVKPDNPIRDYLTRFSGLTAEKLENVSMRLEDVQKDLTQLLDYNTILVGHSLECDLRVLKLIHSRVIDTSVIYQHPRGPPFKASLKWLAQKWLKKEIQAKTGEEGGHDSEEDARTAIELVKLKMEKGPGFGEFVVDQETIFERIGRGQDPKTSAVVDHGSPGQWHGAKATTAVACQTDEEVLQGLLDSIESHDLTIGRFMELSHSLGWSQPAAEKQASAAEPNGAVQPEDPDAADPSAAASARAEAALTALNDRLQRLHAALPPLTALIVFTGQSSPVEMSRLAAKKAKFDRLWKTVKQSEIANEDKWYEADDRALVDEVERCRWGLSFFCVK
ncbi:hypothetical protein JCM8202_001136 [Rhodotorula sphaerocarpa]